MVAIAIGLVWLGYTSGLYGYCLLRGYNVTPKQLLSPSWPPSTVAGGPPPSSGGGVQPNGPGGANIPGYGPGGTTQKPGPGSAYGGK